MSITIEERTEQIDPIRQAQATLVLIGQDTGAALVHNHRRMRIESLLAQIEETQTAIRQAKADHRSWLERLTEVSHTIADDRRWCDIFDNGMEQVGLPMREEDVPVTATLTFQQEVDADDISDAVVKYATGDDSPTSEEIEVEGSVTVTINVEVSRHITVYKGQCACHLYDRDTILEDTPAWIDDKDFEIESTTCANCG